jgi:hypothetical protein
MLSTAAIFIALVIILVIINLAGAFFNLFEPFQLFYMDVSTILLLLVVWLFHRLTESDEGMYYATLIGLFYLVWYILTYVMSNYLNRDGMGVVRMSL